MPTIRQLPSESVSFTELAEALRDHRVVIIVPGRSGLPGDYITKRVDLSAEDDAILRALDPAA